MASLNTTTTSTLTSCEPLLALIGDLWSLAIIILLSQQPMRFNELKRSIPGVNAVTLQNRLKQLDGAGFILREEGTVSRQSIIYKLTPRGMKLVPVVEAIQAAAKELL